MKLKKSIYTTVLRRIDYTWCIFSQYSCYMVISYIIAFYGYIVADGLGTCNVIEH